MAKFHLVPPPKTVWSDKDFAFMGWHDNEVHAIALEPDPPSPGRLLIDLDYILEWVTPVSSDDSFTFWICPATLVLNQASDISLDVNFHAWAFEMEIAEIERTGPDEHGNFSWSIGGHTAHQFEISLRAPGFTQYLRQPPIQVASKRLTLEQRGGLSFEERGY